MPALHMADSSSIPNTNLQHSNPPSLTPSNSLLTCAALNIHCPTSILLRPHPTNYLSICPLNWPPGKTNSAQSQVSSHSNMLTDPWMTLGLSHRLPLTISSNPLPLHSSTHKSTGKCTFSCFTHNIHNQPAPPTYPTLFLCVHIVLVLFLPTWLYTQVQSSHS